MAPAIRFEIEATDERTGARAGKLHTPHGIVETPAFMPVGTQATVKTLSPDDLRTCGVSMILANAYHLYLRPGATVVREAGGLHRFMSWDGSILTDSGGFQVFSMADLNRISDDGVEFRSHLDGSRHMFTPESVIRLEVDLGADVIMLLDQCAAYPCTHVYAEAATERTLNWARRCLQTFRDLKSGPTEAGRPQALFGIVQGSTFPDLRARCAQELAGMDFPGYAVGGLSVGEPKSAMEDMVDVSLEYLPEEKPRYLMGVGFPDDLVAGVSHGIDMFDCVMPTRNARNGTVFTRRGKLVVKNAEYQADLDPIDPKCECSTCRTFSRAYLRHLFQTGEILGPRLATLHSIFFYQWLMQKMRLAILENRFYSWRREFLETYEGGWNGES
ncbi:MAG: tRNA guanosine(34) transglycosylase Tgt [Candidatus Eisenbacteria sp.]|nr:tRNA guanosine(34) transglycosylase Tgt [Candidatus Eisenbacteria bacterium]